MNMEKNSVYPDSSHGNEKNSSEIIKRAAEIEPEIIEIWKCFHESPELGGEEFETAKMIEDYLSKLGIEILGKNIGGTGIVAKIHGKENGPTIALRADMDALPVIENESHLSRSKNNGVMHACGHDANTTGLIGAAKLLKESANRGDLNGDIILLFQPNEEKARSKKTGAVSMIKFLEKEGLREKIKSFLGLHLFTQLERGQVLLSDDIQMAGSGFVDVKLKSGGGHGININTSPDIDSILSEIKLKLNDAFIHYWESGEALVASMGPKVETKADNVMLSEGGRTYVLRITSHDYKRITMDINKTIKDMVENIVKENIEKSKLRAIAMGEMKNDKDTAVEIEIEVKHNYRPVIHRDANLVNIASETVKEIVGNKYQRINKSLMASEDFSFYLEKLRGKQIPGIFLMIGAANSEKGIHKVPHHSPDFKFDTEVIKDLSAIYTNFSLKVIEFFSKQTNVMKKQNDTI